MNPFLLVILVILFNVTVISSSKNLREASNDMVNATINSPIKSCQITEYVLALQHDCGFESIHGLWPDPEATCTACTSEVFSTSALTASTLAGMNKYWPTCQSGTNEAFWSHEWSKHGTCSGLSQEGYFSKTLDLFSQYQSKCTSTCDICLTPSFQYQGLC